MSTFKKTHGLSREHWFLAVDASCPYDVVVYSIHLFHIHAPVLHLVLVKVRFEKEKMRRKK